MKIELTHHRTILTLQMATVWVLTIDIRHQYEYHYYTITRWRSLITGEVKSSYLAPLNTNAKSGMPDSEPIFFLLINAGI